MKPAVYLAMCLLLGPMVPVAGVALSAVFIVAMIGVGLYLIFHRKDRAENGPDHTGPQVVVVLPGGQQWGVGPTLFAASAEGAPLRALHPARRPHGEQPPLWVRPGQ